MSQVATRHSETREWPHRTASRFIAAGNLTWHVQTFGSGPVVLLIHGTGAATHSWREVAPELARNFTVIAPDLPGHGFTSAPPFEESSLPGMAAALGALLRELKVSPAIAVGHSAGAAILARMALDGVITPRLLVSINGALLPLAGIPGWVFAPLAKILARSSLVPRFVARRAAAGATIERLVADTGSQLDAEGISLYRMLAQRPAHVAAALAMMANWDLQSFARDLPRLQTPLVLLTASGDRTIAPEQANRVRALLPGVRTISMGSLGHLAHEERPHEVGQILVQIASEAGVLPA